MRLGKLVLALVVAALVAAACSSDGDDGDGSTTTGPTTTTAPAGPEDPAAAEAEIRENFETYFDSSTPEADGLALVQDVEGIGELLREANASAPPGDRSVRVTDVTFTSATTATVTFDILIGGAPALTGFIGDAALEDGVWKVGRKTNCDLIALQGVTCPAA